MALCIGVLFTAISCGDDGGGDTRSATVVELIITPSAVNVAVGDTTQLTATARLSDDSEVDVTAEAMWAADTEGVTVGNDETGGLVTAISAGSTRVSATYMDLEATAPITVFQPGLTLTVAPTTLQLPLGADSQLVATASVDGGHGEEVTNEAIWTSTNDQIVTVDAGLVRAVDQGSATVEVTYEGAAASVSVTVGEAVPESIVIFPEEPALALGGELTLTASSVLTDGTRQEVTDQVVWASNDESIVTITTTGVATGVSYGNGYVEATLGAVRGERLLRVRRTQFTSSPVHGESGVAVTRETVLRFERPLAEGTVITADQFYATVSDVVLPGRIHMSPDRRTVTLFYDEPLPPSRRVAVTFDGTGVNDDLGNPVDPAGNGTDGGDYTFEFDTLSLTLFPGTRVMGRVFASELAGDPDDPAINVPLEGVTITVDGIDPSELSAVTDAEGTFVLEPAPAGRFFVHIDGRTATAEIDDDAYYPFVGKSWASSPGKETIIGDVFLPLIREGTLQDVSSTEPTEIHLADAVLDEHPELADMFVTVPPDSLFSDDGSRGGQVGIAPVPADRLPGELPPGLDFPAVLTVQTDGPTNFDIPVPVCFINKPVPETGEPLPAGADSALWSFNHDTGAFEVVGPMTVSEDGGLICTDEGVGVLAPGWHCDQPGCEMGNRPRRCVQFGLKDLWDLTKKVADCAARIAPVIKILTGAIKIVESAINLQQQISMLVDEANAGGVSVRRLSMILMSLNDLKSGIGDVLVDLSDNNLLSRARTVALCALDIGQFLFEKLACGAAMRCGGTTAQTICSAFNAALRNAFNLLDKIEKVEDRLKVAGLDVACVAIGELTTSINQATEPTPGALVGDTIPPELINELQAFLPELDFLVEAEADTLDAVAETQPVSDTLVELSSAAPEGLMTYGGFGGAHYYLSVAGFEQRGIVGPGGDLRVRMQPEAEYLVEVVNLEEQGMAVSRGISVRNGRQGTLAVPEVIDLSLEEDTDGDGIADIAEHVFGTMELVADSDGDGILDGAEILAGTDPLDGLVVETGIIASADTPGRAVDVCAMNDLAAVADSAGGVTIFNVFQGMDPVVVAQFELPTSVNRVACATDAVALADSHGLTMIALDEPGGRIAFEIPLGSASAVVERAGIVYVGVRGALYSVDRRTGSLLEEVELATMAPVDDVVVTGNTLYAAQDGQIHVLPLGAPLAVANTIPHDTAGRPFFGYRLFAGADELIVTTSRGYATYDLSDPLAPAPIGGSVTTARGWKHTVLNGSGLAVVANSPNFALDGSHDAAVYDARDLFVTDAFVAGFPTPGVASAVSLYNGYAYVADYEAGLQVINYLPYDGAGQPPTLEVSANFALDLGLAEEGSPLILFADVTDDVQVRNVEFLVNGERVVDGNYPFEYAFVTPTSDIAPGLTVQVRATDTGGNVTESPLYELTLVEDAVRPRLLRVDPRPESARVRVQTLAAYFDEPIETTGGDVRFRVSEVGADGIGGNSDDVPVTGGVFSFDDNALAAYLDLPAPLPEGRYYATIDDAADLAGNPTDETVEWEFLIQPGPVIFPPASDVLAQLELNGDTLDTSGGGRDGVVTGPEYVDTSWGQGLYVHTGQATPGLDWSAYAGMLAHPFTIEIVLTPDDTIDWAKIFGFDPSADQGWYYKDEGLQLLPSPSLGLGELLSGVRHYLAFVSTSASTVDIYLAGQYLGSSDMSFTAPPSSALFFRDDSSTSPTEQFEGVVDGLRISSTTRTEDELAGVQDRLLEQ